MLFIYREDYYLKAVEPDYPMPDEIDKLAKYEEWKRRYDPVAGRAEVIVAKQRHGSTGIVRGAVRRAHDQVQRAVDEGYLPGMRGG